ncbi:MAG: glycosyltransferase family 39 protein [Saprospiraceae bacterium]|nr:glycosyltransferase family 39 protein [Saprospiraceae bacterium]
MKPPKKKSPDPETYKANNTVAEKKWTLQMPLLCIPILLVLTYFTFKSALDNQFVNWDDQVYVEEQPLVLSKEYAKLWKTPVSLNYHPITMISLAMQVPADTKKLSPAPFIHLNIWLHILNSLFVFLLIWLINEKKWLVALLTAAIFAIHPMHVESVVWVSERKDVLYTLFFLLGCITYWQYLEKNNKSWLVLTFACFVLSVLSKAMGVVLPVVLLLLDYWKGRNLKDVAIWLEKIPFLAVSIFFGLMAVSVQSGGNFGGLLTLYGEKTKAVAAAGTFSFWERCQFASYGFVKYILKFFNPTKICAFYPYPPGDKLVGIEAMAYPLTFVLISGLTLFSAFKSRIWAFGMGFYFITVALVLQFMSVGLAIMADRYTYIPYIGLAFMMVYALDKWSGNFSQYMKYLNVTVCSGFILFLIIKTRSQVEVWQNSETLWTQTLQYYPTEDLALANRGNNRGKTGNIAAAMADFEAAVSDGCNRADVYEGLGNSYGTLSEQQPDKKSELVAKAISMYQKAIQLEPNNGQVKYNLGIAQLQSDPAASEVAFTEAIKLMPYKEADILPVLGMSQVNSGKYVEATRTLTKAITGGNKTESVIYNRALANLGAGNTEAAKADFNAVLLINPGNQDAKNRLSAM